MLSLLRLKEPLLGQIRAGQDLGGIARRALLLVLIGSSAYGAAFGLWRHPLSALGSALKLPAMLLGVTLLTALASALVSPLLRASLSLKQTVVLVLVSFAVTSAILGALSPVAIFVVLCQAPVDPRAVGLAASDPIAAPSVATAQALVLFHTAVIAIAGVAGVLRLYRILGLLLPAAGVASRVVVAWIGLQLLVGAQLAWLMRPFLGSPLQPLRLLPDSIEGSFFEEVLMLSSARFGASSPWVLTAFALAIGVWLAGVLRQAPQLAEVRVLDGGLLVVRPIERLVPWAHVRQVRVERSVVHIVVADGALFEDVLQVRAEGRREAERLGRTIERARTLGHHGPFRTASAID